ncbi:zinc finger matrin-type protein 5-like isoform X2 [Adelges cooleyi]|uniref:zinc finger matrin-type protein 5-like isoform X2 n=1 Tax=Adelges cooleyi TaxID=133065 RepID=UPI002180877E|nr:zinc finger matrin-type protein 5-like isoform X2 [Adelges cooleyi]
MVKKILCEYCNITFADNLSSRNLHLNSNAHKKNRKNYYSLHKDAVTLFFEERQKQTCRRFQNSGQCQFGINCNHSHYTYNQLIYLIQQEYAEKKYKQQQKINSIPSITSWQIKYQKDFYNNNIERETSAQNIELNLQGEKLPSLMPVNVEQLKNLQLNTWINFQG